MSLRTASGILGMLLLIAGAWPGEAAPPYDGSAPLLCAVSSIVECENTATCERRQLEEAGMPTFFRVNFADATVIAADASGAKAEVRTATRADGRLILQGGQQGRGWTATIAEDTGKMTVAVVDHDAGFVIFGACTTP
jgi:hypothetical protein